MKFKVNKLLNYFVFSSIEFLILLFFAILNLKKKYLNAIYFDEYRFKYKYIFFFYQFCYYLCFLI